ncbi:MAG: DUF1365 domain-containing protein [Alphaproteobacteria bacterium]|nr:DUF1365 domain-containing protein [Alphaproteobacteria bacterium]
MNDAALYAGRVMHHRLRPFRHRFSYRICAALFDLDRLPALAAGCRLFSHNRANLVSFHDADHGQRNREPLRPHIERLLAEAGMREPPVRILLLCYPRMLGYVFNPLSVYFCYDDANRLFAIVHEVKNTFGEQHSYVLPANVAGPVRQVCDKRFYVSPFIAMRGTYRFAIRPPAEQVSLIIAFDVPEGPQLLASFVGRRRKFDDWGLVWLLLRFPLMTLKVILAIHWQALRLWLRGARLVPRRPPGLAPPGASQ